MKITCPHCGETARIRTSRALTPLSREAYVQCPNIFCGHTWRVLISAVSTVTPSRQPRAEIFLREYPHE
ncbi:hypothetical protein AGMMS49545_18090 [Betaproteobacteria bacterium]|nr:hypothetical protein AGMMS49545_18090 [Betaproteobacteria bacterium]GHU45190.1 hypothetical protein AGMMS50289_15740 [Betaproteobacteria bacterium]